MILKSGQMKINGGTGKCDLCVAVDHAETFHKQFDITKEEQDGSNKDTGNSGSSVRSISVDSEGLPHNS
jgi:hypothetical protein